MFQTIEDQMGKWKHDVKLIVSAAFLAVMRCCATYVGPNVLSKVVPSFKEGKSYIDISGE